MNYHTYTVDGRTFHATSAACKSADAWRKAFPAVYGHMPAHASRAFAARDFAQKTRVSTQHGRG